MIHFVGHFANLARAGGNDQKLQICWTVSFKPNDLVVTEYWHFDGEEGVNKWGLKGGG